MAITFYSSSQTRISTNHFTSIAIKLKLSHERAQAFCFRFNKMDPHKVAPSNPNNKSNASQQQPVNEVQAKPIRTGPITVINPKKYASRFGIEDTKRKSKVKVEIRNVLNRELDVTIDSINNCFRDVLECSKVTYL